MKNHLSGRKHLLAFVLAAAFVLGIAVPVLATGYLNDIDINNKQQIQVTAVCDAPEYNVELEWGGMEFHYQYGRGWDYSKDSTFNEIKVQNAGFTPVAVKFDFNGNGGHTGRFNTDHAGDGNDYQALYLSAATQQNFPNAKMYLILDDKRPSSSSVGEITLTLTEVVQDDGQALINERGDANIGYVTSDSRLIPFIEKDLNR